MNQININTTNLQNRLNRTKSLEFSEDFIATLSDVINFIDKNGLNNIEDLTHFLMGRKNINDLPKEFTQNLNPNRHLTLNDTRNADNLLRTHRYIFSEKADKTLDKLKLLLLTAQEHGADKVQNQQQYYFSARKLPAESELNESKSHNNKLLLPEGQSYQQSSSFKNTLQTQSKQTIRYSVKTPENTIINDIEQEGNTLKIILQHHCENVNFMLNKRLFNIGNPPKFEESLSTFYQIFKELQGSNTGTYFNQSVKEEILSEVKNQCLTIWQGAAYKLINNYIRMFPEDPEAAILNYLVPPSLENRDGDIILDYEKTSASLDALVKHLLPKALCIKYSNLLKLLNNQDKISILKDLLLTCTKSIETNCETKEYNDATLYRIMTNEGLINGQSDNYTINGISGFSKNKLAETLMLDSSMAAKRVILRLQNIPAGIPHFTPTSWKTEQEVALFGPVNIKMNTDAVFDSKVQAFVYDIKIINQEMSVS